MKSNRTIENVKMAVKFHLEGVVADSEFSQKVLGELFRSSQWDSLMNQLTRGQSEIVRNYADDYFEKNNYSPRPYELPQAATAAEVKEATESNKEKWKILHQWIIEIT